jgi:hypothetical protein
LSSEKYRILYTKNKRANALGMRFYPDFSGAGKGRQKTGKWPVLEGFNPV